MLQHKSLLWGCWNLFLQHQLSCSFCSKPEKLPASLSSLDSSLHHAGRFESFPAYIYIYIYKPVYCICELTGLGDSVLALFNDYEDTDSGDVRNVCLDVSSWEVFSLLPSADYTEYLICFSNRSSWGFGNTVKKKDVRRSWEERWRVIAGERRAALINRRSLAGLSGSRSSRSPETDFSLSVSFLLFSSSFTLPF